MNAGLASRSSLEQTRSMGVELEDGDTLANGVSFSLDTDAGPVDYMDDVPVAGEYADLRSRGFDRGSAPPDPLEEVDR